MKPVKNKLSLPFQNMKPGGWLNLALVAIAVYFILQVAFDQINNNICRNRAVDYCAFWSAGKISNMQGYADVYDLNLLKQFQKNIYPQLNDPSPLYDVVPFLYLPIFILPFQLLAFLNLEISFWVWTLVNLFGFMLYLRYFTKETTGRPLPVRLLFLFVLSLPVLLNLFWGQLNIILGIIVGEVVRTNLANKPFRSGLWLGGLLIKPQLLLLIIPVLLLQRSYKMLTGWLSATILVFTISFFMINIKGFERLFLILLGSAQGGNASSPEIMMNWRMLGLFIGSYSTPAVGLSFAIIASIITAIVTLVIFRKPFSADPIKTTVIFLGIFTATGMVAWHAHFSMSIIFIPMLIYLNLWKYMSNKLLYFWAFIPVIFTFIVSILSIPIHLGSLPSSIIPWLTFQTGVRGLILNLILYIWAIALYCTMKDSTNDTSRLQVNS